MQNSCGYPTSSLNMKDYQFHEIDTLMDQARQRLVNSQAIIKEVIDESAGVVLSEESTTTQAQMIELVLQYRMDSQNSLAKLLQIDHGLLQILGISSLNSSGINLERMQFALGHDDLLYILNALGQLIHSLLRMAQRAQQNLDRTSKQKQRLNHLPTKTNTRLARCCERLQKAVVEQELFVSSLTDISNYLDEWNKLAAIGPVLDHIAGLRGPICEFFETIQQGLELTKSIYETISPELQLDLKLDAILEQAESLLKHIPMVYLPNHFFSPTESNTPEKLEERASLRRLGHFFNH